MYNIIESLRKIQNELHQLSTSYDEEINNIAQGEDFDGKSDLIGDHLENLLIAATHETSSNLAFYIQDISTLVSFIAFRKQFSNLSSILLRIAIDHQDIPIQEKISIEKHYPLEVLREEWHQQFGSRSYEKLIQQFGETGL